MNLALRQLGKTPGFTIVAVLIFAIGIGAATTMFSTVNALILRPVALPEPDRLMAIYETNLPRNQPFFSVSVPNYSDWTNRAQSWTSLAAMSWRAMNLTGAGEPELIQVKQVTANFLPTLGVPTMLGRNFLEAEDRPGGAPVAILSDAFWRRRFGGAPDIIDRTMILDGTPYTIVGVTAPGQPLPGDIEVAVPLAADPAKEDRLDHGLEVYGRLKPGVAIEQADAELKGIAAQIATTLLPAAEQGWSTRLVPFAQEIVGDSIRTMLYVLLGAVALLLLIACANLSNLLLVRASARAHEFAIRAALGANRSQIVRQILTESLVVTLSGGIAGVIVSLWAIEFMRSSALPRAKEISIDPRVLAVACIATVLAGVLSSLGPALKASLTRPQAALKGRTPNTGRRSRLRDAMVVAQLGISLTLLVGVALLARSFWRLLQVDPGFRSEHVLTVSLRPAGNAPQFYEQLAERVATLPGVSAVGLISSLPLTSGNTSLNVFPEAESVVPAGNSIQSSWRLVDGGYFSAMQIPLLHGRTFSGLTPDEARRSLVISAQLAKQLWGDADPVGRRVDPGGNGRWLTVIGVVGDVRSQNLAVEPIPAFYWSMYRFLYGPMHLVVRSEGEFSPLLAGIRSAARDIDPVAPIFRVRTLEQLRATSLEHESLALALLGGFTVVALLLAALGTYGVVAFGVHQRTREIGIRLAVGAQRGDILRLIVGHGGRLVILGLAVGLAFSAVFARVLGSMLYDTLASDPLSYLIAVLVLFVAALGACLLPAHRATKVDPLVALRAE